MPDPVIMWEALLTDLRGSIIEYAKSKRRGKTQRQDIKHRKANNQT